MTKQSVVDLWNYKNQGKTTSTIPVALRQVLADKVEEQRMKYGLSRNQVINDILSLGFFHLEKDNENNKQ